MLQSNNQSQTDEQIKKLILKNNLCRNYDRYLQIEDKNEINIMMGIGMISPTEGISQGLPLDVLNMLIPAKEVIKTLEEMNKQSTIHILIADHLAKKDESDPLANEKVELMTSLYREKLSTIMSNLGIRHKVIFHLSSELVKNEEYNTLLEQVKKSSIGVDNDHLSYFQQQTALCAYLHQHHGCDVKIGWSRSHVNNQIQKAHCYDEAHFDRIYREILPKKSGGLSFIYVDSGHHEGKNVVPYCAAGEGAVGRILISQDLDSLKDVSIKDQKLVNNINQYAKYLGLNTQNQPPALQVENILQCITKPVIVDKDITIEQVSSKPEKCTVQPKLTYNYDTSLLGWGHWPHLEETRRHRASVKTRHLEKKKAAGNFLT